MSTFACLKSFRCTTIIIVERCVCVSCVYFEILHFQSIMGQLLTLMWMCPYDWSFFVQFKFIVFYRWKIYCVYFMHVSVSVRLSSNRCESMRTAPYTHSFNPSNFIKCGCECGVTQYITITFVQFNCCFTSSTLIGWKMLSQSLCAIVHASIFFEHIDSFHPWNHWDDHSIFNLSNELRLPGVSLSA